MRARVGDRTSAGDRLRPGARVAAHLRTVDLHAAAHDVGRPAQRHHEEVGGVEDHVGDAEAQGGRGVELGVLRERVLDDDRDRVLRPDEVREQPRPAPARDDPERDLGQREGADVRRDGAVVAVQRELQAAAHRRPVDEREGGHAEAGEVAEDAVAELGDRLDVGALVQAREQREVGTDGEHVGLAGDGDGVEVVALAQCGERALDRHEPGGSERRGPTVVLTVVQRDERDPDRVVTRHGDDDVAHVRAGDDLGRGAHRAAPVVADCQRGFSHTTVPPWPSPTHIVVMP